MIKYQRILLKLSGESLGTAGEGVNLNCTQPILANLKELTDLGIQIGLVIGGGNLVRGASYVKQGIDQETADYIGMMATVMNGLTLERLLNQVGIKAALFSALSVPDLITNYSAEKALEAFDKHAMVIFAGGTGKPFCTTDTAATNYAIDIHADILLKATTVDGVYSEDPKKNPHAKRYQHLTYQEALEKNLAVMDRGAFEKAQQAKLVMRVFNMNKAHVLKNIVMGEDEGTLVSCG